MSNTNPYELRFQIFETARNVLVDQYWAEKERRQCLIETGGVDMDTIPKYPEYPELEEVMAMASKINSFVSNS